jgi:hypothetical protein
MAPLYHIGMPGFRGTMRTPIGRGKNAHEDVRILFGRTGAARLLTVYPRRWRTGVYNKPLRMERQAESLNGVST